MFGNFSILSPPICIPFLFNLIGIQFNSMYFEFNLRIPFQVEPNHLGTQKQPTTPYWEDIAHNILLCYHL